MFQSIREPQMRVSTANEEIAHSGGGDLNAVLLPKARRYLFPRCSGSSRGSLLDDPIAGFATGQGDPYVCFSSCRRGIIHCST
jgi:hypothetical protein